MNLQEQIQNGPGFGRLDLLAKKVVEGFISGLHASPFHGFSAEFAEHTLYHPGQSTKHIDWKLYAKTDRLYTKKYEEETNLRCHVIIDQSSSMHYPALKKQSLRAYNKIGFAALATASLMQLFKKQRDAMGLSLYSDAYDFYLPEKGSERHFQLLLHQLEQMLTPSSSRKKTATYEVLHQIAEKVKRRSLIFLFTDLLQAHEDQEQLLAALRHLNHNKHELVVFHTLEASKEMDFDFEDTPKKFTDVETGEELAVYPSQLQEAYRQQMKSYQNLFKQMCLKNKIQYQTVDIQKDLQKILITYLIERQGFK